MTRDTEMNAAMNTAFEPGNAEKETFSCITQDGTISKKELLARVNAVFDSVPEYCSPNEISRAHDELLKLQKELDEAKKFVASVTDYPGEDYGDEPDFEYIDCSMDKPYFALCPLDGRYSQIAEDLAPYCSEFGLVSYRVEIEVNWLLYQIKHIHSEVLDSVRKHLSPDEYCQILGISKYFDEDDFLRVKEIESKTKHDVKAVELFVAENLKEFDLEELVSYVHIGCTSEDITNLSYACMLSDVLDDVYYPEFFNLFDKLLDMASENADVPMLAHTHGQPATPTTVGKELVVYVHRLAEQFEVLNSIPIYGKFNGATGNYAAISAAFPEVDDWPAHSKNMIENFLGLDFNPVTTQIESHDYTARLLEAIRHINNIIIDFDRDMWMYISMEYFKQVAVKGEVGSSTMPHKVNPIKFENSEGNLELCNFICMGLSEKLTKSRMQRDLTDSTVQRNIGMVFGYSLQGIRETINGLKRVSVNKEKLEKDLNDNWEVLGEPIQTVLRRYGNPEAYNQLKELTRGKRVTADDMQTFIKGLEIPEAAKDALLKLTPATYIGLAAQIVRDEIKQYQDEK